MEDGFDLRNRSILSHSYMQRVKRLSGNPSSSEDGYEISEEKLKSREKSWSWLFQKFSKITDAGELNILTLEPDTESNGTHVSEIRIPVRKTTAQLQYWINTGNAPCQAMAMEASDTDETVSISESEPTNSNESEALRSTSMKVNKKLDNSREQLIATGSSASSVDTATYIKQNGKSGKKKERNGLRNLDNNIVGRSINAAVPRVLLSRLPENIAAYKKPAIVDEKEKSLPGIVTRDEIVSEKNVGDKIDQVFEKRSKTEDAKDSEVTFESKESGIGSLGVDNLRNTEKREDKKSSSSSEDQIFAPNRSTSHGKRKLFTQNDTFFDIISPMVKSVHRISSIRKSFHPAFDSPSTKAKIKTKNRPRLLTMRRRKSINHSINKLHKNKSSVSKSKTFNKTSAPPGDDVADSNTDLNATNDCEDRGERGEIIASQIELTLTKESNEDDKRGNNSAAGTSSSLSSRDVSLILSEEWNKSSETPMNQNRQCQVKNMAICEIKDLENDQGSIFKPQADSSSESKESRLRNMRHVKKNLCLDLRSSGDTDSPSTSISDPVADNIEDSISNASTILLPNSQRLNERPKLSQSTLINGSINSAQLMPVVMLHDFLNLKSCCGELEKESKEIWLCKVEKKGENSETDKKGVESYEKTVGKVKSKRTIDEKILARKKLRLEKKAAASKHNRQTLFTRYSGFGTDDSLSSGGKVLRLEIERLDNDFNHSSTTGRESFRVKKLDGKTETAGNSMITFTNTNHNRWKPIFVSSSSEDEDPFTTLNNNSRSRSLGEKKGEDREERESSISARKNGTLNDSAAAKSAVTIQDCYKIVASSSEDEVKSKRVSGRARVKERYLKRNKQKDSGDFEPTRISPGKNESGDASEDSKSQNEKLGKKSPGVIEGLRKKRGEQSPEASRESPEARSKVNKEIRRDRVCRSGNKSEVKISGKTKDADRVFAPETNDKENAGTKISENLISPVDRVSDSLQKRSHEISKPRNSRGKERQGRNRSFKDRGTTLIEKSRSPLQRPTLRKIRRAAESSDSEEDCGVWRVTKLFKDGRQSGSKIDDDDEILGKDGEESSSVSSGFIFNDESSGVDDTMTFQPRNYPGDNSRGKKVRRRDTESDKRGTDSKADAANSSSRKNAAHRRTTTSKIVFRTKEYWESDSDNW